MNGLNSVTTGQKNEKPERYEQNEKRHLRLKEDLLLGWVERKKHTNKNPVHSISYFNYKTMNTKLEQKKKEYEEVKIKILELQKLRKSLYNHIYITEMREKQKKV